MKVKEVAGLVGISVRTLHHYDEVGLLKPEKITESGYRLYSNHDLEMLQLQRKMLQGKRRGIFLINF